MLKGFMKINSYKFISFFLLSLSTMLTFGQVQKSLVGFQSIPWGSGTSVVKAKFPNAKEQDFCKLFSATKNNYQELKNKFNEENSGCIQVTDANYNIEGLKFYAEFRFDPQNKLNEVTLTLSRKQSEVPDYLSECNSAYNRIATLLDTKYGPYITVANLDEFSKSYTTYAAKSWLPMPTEIWVGNFSGDKFLKSMSTELNKPESDICKVKVHYSKRISDAANKL